MARWPDATELAQVLDVSNEDDWALTLGRVMAAAIARVKRDVGNWVEGTDEPDEQLAQAALRMGELLSLKPENAASTSSDPTYRRLLKGHRRTFGVSTS